MVRILLTLIVLAATAGSVPAAEKAAGTVRGQVVLSPACPGPARIGAGKCATRPVPATVDVFKADERTRPSISVAADASGRFAIELAPGRYLFVPRSPSPGTSSKPVEVTVAAATVTDVTLTVDSGLR